MKGYFSYLNSEHWKLLKEAKRQLVGDACQSCFGRDNIHGHHIRYRNLTDCTADDIMMLCERCHDYLHKAAKYRRLDVTMLTESLSLCLIADFRDTPDCARLVMRKEHRQAVRIASKRLRKARAKLFKAAFAECLAGRLRREAVTNLIAFLQANLDP